MSANQFFERRGLVVNWIVKAIDEQIGRIAEPVQPREVLRRNEISAAGAAEGLALEHLEAEGHVSWERAADGEASAEGPEVD